MAYLNSLELGRLKQLLSGKELPGAEQLSALDILRSRFPDFLAALPGITKENLKDNKFLIRYFANPYNRNKIKNALRKELSLTPAQQIDLEKSLQEPAVTKEASSQPAAPATATSSQAAPPTGTAGPPAGGAPLGMPSAPASPPRVFIARQTPPPGGKEEGTGQGLRFQTGPMNTLKNFGSRIGTGINKGLNKTISGINNFGKGGGAGSRSIFGKLGRIGKRSKGFSVGKTIKGRGGIIFAGSVFGAMALVGVLALTGASPVSAPGEAAPIPIASPTPSPTPATTIVASCPVTLGRITARSYQSDPAGGHCSDSYIQLESCPDSCRFTGRKSKSIDVFTGGPNGNDVILPQAGGKDVNWKLLEILCSAHGQTPPNCGSIAGETGYMYLFDTVPQNPTDTKWSLELVHMLPNNNLKKNETYPTGTILGKTDINIVHITIGSNIADPSSPGSISTDCDQGWMPADPICPGP